MSRTNEEIQCGKLRLFKKGVVTRNSQSNLKYIDSNLQCAKNRLIVPSQCFQNKSFLKSMNKSPPLSSTLGINAHGYLILLLTKTWRVKLSS